MSRDQTYVPDLDEERLGNQRDRVRQFMGSDWHTLREVEEWTGDTTASISARLRDFRKPEFGGHAVERRRRGDETKGIHEYRILGPGTHTAAAHVPKPTHAELGVAMAHIRSLMQCQKIAMADRGGYKPPTEMGTLGRWLAEIVRKTE